MLDLLGKEINAGDLILANIHHAHPQPAIVIGETKGGRTRHLVPYYKYSTIDPMAVNPVVPVGTIKATCFPKKVLKVTEQELRDFMIARPFWGHQNNYERLIQKLLELQR